MIERSCVYKFIDGSQTAYSNGASLYEVLGQVDHYQSLVRRVYGPISNPIHKIFTSKMGLTGIAACEYARAKGFPLPDANTVLQTIWPIKRSLRLSLCGGEDIFDERPDAINF